MSVMDPPPIQYAQSPDGASIAYWIMRNGPTAAVHLPYGFANLDIDWQFPEFAAWYQRLGAGRTLITYDMAQMGLSRDPSNSRSVPRKDLEAVLDDAGVQRAALLAPQLMAWTAITFAAQHPKRVSHLVLWGASTRGTDLYPDAITASAEIGAVDRDQYVRVLCHSVLGWSHGEAADRLANALLAGSDHTNIGSARQGMIERLKAVNLDDLATQLDVPTLILHPRGTHWMTEDPATRLAATIPNARLILLDGDSLHLAFGATDQALEAINSFLAEPRPAPSAGATSEVDPASAAPVGPPYPDRLSEREVQVLRLVATGLRNAEIADHLVISPNTVARHISHIFNKTGVTNRAEATRYAIRNALSE